MGIFLKQGFRNRNAGAFLHVLHDRAEYRLIAGKVARSDPGQPFKPGSHINDFCGELLVAAWGYLILHKDAVPKLQPAHEVFYAGAEVSASCPDILLEYDFLLRYPKGFQIIQVMLHCLLLPVEEPGLLCIEGMLAYHDEISEVPSRNANV